MSPVIPKITPPAVVTSTPPAAASAAANGAADSPRSSLRMGTRGPAEPGGAERKFRSLADLQQAIKDGEQKKEEIVTQTKNQRQQRQEKLAAVAQPVDPNNPAAAGTRTRTATRTQRRPTISIPTANASKITQQLGQFVSMLQALEGEFAKAEEQRIKKDEELSKMRGVMLRY
jgi:hypothetical protein